MQRLIFFGMAILLILCACENTLNHKVTGLQPVDGNVLINRSVLKTGGSYAVGYANGNIRSDRISLTWQRCTDEKFLSYKLFRNNNLIKTFINASQTAYIDSVLLQDMAYNYRLVCFVENGMAVQDTIQLKTPQFEAPSSVMYTYLSPTSLKLSWTNNAESATSYSIEKRVGMDPEVFPFTSSTPYFNDNNVEAGEYYVYRVKSNNAYEDTDWSDWTGFTFSYIMGAPSLYQPTQVFPGTKVRLEWEDNSTAETSFKIYRGVGSAVNMQPLASVDDNVTEYMDASAKQIGETYYYQIHAHNSTESVSSNIHSVLIVEQDFVLYDFEANDGDFTSNTPSGWQWGSSSHTWSHSGIKLWGASLNGSYQNGANYQLTSPMVEIPANSSLTFYHKHWLEYGWDGGNVKMSLDGGNTWNLITPLGGYDESEINSSGEPGFTSSLSDWTLVTFDLSAYAGQTARFRWTLTSDGSVTDWGWFIDDVRVGTALTLAGLE